MTAIWVAPEPVRLEIVPIEAPVLSFTASPTVKLAGAADWAVALAGAPEPWADGAAVPGTLEGLLVATGDGALELIEVQPEGKRVMAATAWRAGLRVDARVDG